MKGFDNFDLMIPFHMDNPNKTIDIFYVKAQENGRSIIQKRKPEI